MLSITQNGVSHAIKNGHRPAVDLCDVLRLRDGVQSREADGDFIAGEDSGFNAPDAVLPKGLS